MNFEDFEKKYIKPFTGLDYVFLPGKGFVVWRLGTGGNSELLHIMTFSHGKGHAKELVKEMMKNLLKNPPFYSVFGFALSSRTELKKIYTNLGFLITEDIPAPYLGGPAFIFHQSYEKLKEFYSLN